MDRTFTWKNSSRQLSDNLCSCLLPIMCSLSIGQGAIQSSATGNSFAGDLPDLHILWRTQIAPTGRLSPEVFLIPSFKKFISYTAGFSCKAMGFSLTRN